MASYDSSVIETFADGLYAQAATIVSTYAVLGALFGAGVGGAISYAIRDSSSVVLGLIGAVIVGVIAWQLGQQKAASLRLQAQIALCQVQIERNTRQTH